jgi:hypothetical protein
MGVCGIFFRITAGLNDEVSANRPRGRAEPFPT